MPMTEYAGNTAIIAALGTTPEERGLTDDQFKAKFDEGLKAFVEWFNSTHKTEFDVKAEGSTLTSHIENTTTAHGIDTKMPMSGGTFTGPVMYSRQVAQQPLLKDYTDIMYSQTPPVSAVISLDIANAVKWTLANNVTSIGFGGVAPDNQLQTCKLRIVQGATPYTITWPASVKWPNDTAPTINIANKVYDITLTTMDGGVVWHGKMDGPYSA